MRRTSTRSARRLLLTAGVVVAVSALAACSSGGGGTTPSETTAGDDKAWLEDLEPRVLKLSDFSGNEDSNFGRAMLAWEEAVTEFTDGKITFENYWSASLLAATETLPGVRDGIADIGLIIPTYYPQDLPAATWLSGLGAGLSGSTIHDVAAGGATAMEYTQTLPEINEEFEASNLKVLQATATPAYNLMCTSPIESLEEAEGKQARSSGAVYSGTLEALGMVPVTMAFNEAYEALQRGVIDCIVLNPNQLVSGMVLKDIAPEFVPVTFAQLVSSIWVMSLDVWESFPVELQNFMTEENGRAAYNIWNGYLELEAEAGELIAEGDVVHTSDVAELEPVAQEQREEYVAALPDTAPPSISDAESVVDDYLERLAYWTGILEDEGYPVTERTPEAILDAYAGLADADLSSFYELWNTEYVSTQLQ